MAAATALFVFDTTHHALWAEEIARERGIPAEPVPAPADAGAGCDLALEVLEDDVVRMGQALAEEGVAHRRHTPHGGADPGRDRL